MATTPKRPRDTNQFAKLIVGIATGEVEQAKPDDGKDPAAVALGRKGGLKGGAARAKKLTAKKRSEIVKKAAKRAGYIPPVTCPLSPTKLTSVAKSTDHVRRSN